MKSPGVITLLSSLSAHSQPDSKLCQLHCGSCLPCPEGIFSFFFFRSYVLPHNNQLMVLYRGGIIGLNLAKGIISLCCVLIRSLGNPMTAQKPIIVMTPQEILSNSTALLVCFFPIRSCSSWETSMGEKVRTGNCRQLQLTADTLPAVCRNCNCQFFFFARCQAKYANVYSKTREIQRPSLQHWCTSPFHSVWE